MLKCRCVILTPTRLYIPKKIRNTSFFHVFNDTQKRVNSMIFTRFKDNFLISQSVACSKVVELYMKKEYVQKKEVQIVCKAWIIKSEGIRDMYENVIKVLYII